MEEAIVRALRSPAVRRALSRAMESEPFVDELDPDEVSRLAKRVLDSDAAASVWAEVLASEPAQMLVERVAEAPEIRSAIASQGAGLIRDIGVRLTKVTERLDDAAERVLRSDDPDSEVDQAGLATRSVAAAVDLGILGIVDALISSSLASVIPFVFGTHRSLAGTIIVIVLAALAGGAYFVLFWTLGAQTPGMRFLSIRLVQRGSDDVTFGCAFRRGLALILSLLPFGLGFLAIVHDRSRRGWHDRLVGTEVVYDMSARQAPHSSAEHLPEARRRLQ